VTSPEAGCGAGRRGQAAAAAAGLQPCLCPGEREAQWWWAQSLGRWELPRRLGASREVTEQGENRGLGSVEDRIIFLPVFTM